jgi:hypothetical protein
MMSQLSVFEGCEKTESWHKEKEAITNASKICARRRLRAEIFHTRVAPPGRVYLNLGRATS